MSETVSQARLEYGANYPYLLECQTNWEKPSYRAWWALRTYLEIVRPLKLPRGSNILSVGSGMGHNEQLLTSFFGYNVTSLDFNLPSLKTSRELFNGNIRAVGADATNLPFQNSEFDGVISLDFMEHLTSIEQADKAFREMERVSRNGPMFHKITVLGEEGMEDDTTHHIKMSAEDWNKWFNDRGWKTFRPLEHSVPIWSRKRIGMYQVNGAFYLKKTTD